MRDNFSAKLNETTVNNGVQKNKAKRINFKTRVLKQMKPSCGKSLSTVEMTLKFTQISAEKPA